METIRRKDPYLNELIDVLNIHYERAQGDVQQASLDLSSYEKQIIDEEIEKCSHPFTGMRYYLENYHAIATESQGFTTLHPFWDSQEIFFEKCMEIIIAGRQCKVLVLKARQLGLCLHEDTKVLTDDLRWMRIGDVRPGQRLVAIDEGETQEEFRAKAAARTSRRRAGVKLSNADRIRKLSSRKMRTATVLATKHRVDVAVKITLDDGRQLTATREHRFLCKQRGGCQPVWMQVGDFRVDDEIRYITKPWEESDGDDRWFGGFMDGEGSLRQKSPTYGGVEGSVSQVLGPVYDHAKKYLDSRGYAFREDADKREGGDSSKLGSKPMSKLVVSRMDELFRLIGTARPIRFIGKEWWVGKELPGKNSGIGYSKIVSIESLSEPQCVVDIQTDCKTFIAEGFVSHNSTISEGMIFWKTIFTEVCNALVVAQDPGQADYLFGMSRRAYDRLPWWMRPEARYEAKGRYLQLDRKDEFERILHPGLQSAIFVEAANKMTGVAVGKTIRAAHLSELSAWPNPEVLSTQIFPAMNADDTLAIMESTARGRNNLWFRFWRDCARGKNSQDWTPIFIEFFRVKKYSLPLPKTQPFKLSPEEVGLRAKVLKNRGISITDEQFYWKREKIKQFISLHGDEWKFYQEYPSATWMEAFQGTGICAFNKRKLQDIREGSVVPPKWAGEIYLKSIDDKTVELKGEDVEEGQDVPEGEDVGTRLYIWEHPDRHESYYLGCDVAHGLVGGDYSVVQVIKIGHGMEPDVQVACWHGWINPTPFASVIAALGYYYNTAQISVECNDVGETTNAELMRIIQYPNLFRWKHYDKIKNSLTNHLGWYTNSKTRPMIIAKFREAIDDKSIVLRDDYLIEECLDFASDEGGRFEGQESNDDRVMGVMIARFCAHDSDFGKMASSMPRTADANDFWWLAFDSLFRFRAKFATEEEAEQFCFGKEGWSVRKGAAKSDYYNSEFSPVHDKKGPQHDLVYQHNVPVEAAREMALWGGMPVADDGRDEEWKLW